MVAGVLALTVAVLVVGQMLLYRFCGYKKITYTREYTPNTVFEGESVTMTERISNAKLLPMPWLRVESMLSPHLYYIAQGKSGGHKKEKNLVYGEHNSVFSVGAYQTVTRRYRMYCEKRGYYALRAVNITCQDLFGIGEPHTAEADINAVVTVYPRIASAEELGDLSKNLMGDVVVRRWISEDPFMIRGTREYTTSDPQSKINWKASARTGALMVNENDYTADIKLQIYFNVQADQYFQSDVDPDAIEAGVSRVAYFLQFAAEHGIAAAFASNSVDSPLGENRTHFGSGKGHLGEEFTQLACLSRQAKTDFARFLAYETESGLMDCGILIVSTYIDERIEEQMEVLRRNGNVVAAYLLPRTPGTYTTDKTE